MSAAKALCSLLPVSAQRLPMVLHWPFSNALEFVEFYFGSPEFSIDSKGVYTASICYEIRTIAHGLKKPVSASPASASPQRVPDSVSDERVTSIKSKEGIEALLLSKVPGDVAPIALDLIVASRKAELTDQNLSSYFSAIESPPAGFSQLRRALMWQKSYNGKIDITTELKERMLKSPWSTYRTTATSIPKLVEEMSTAVAAPILSSLLIQIPESLHDDVAAPYDVTIIDSYSARTRAAALLWQQANRKKIDNVWNAQRAISQCPATWVKKCKDAFDRFIELTEVDVSQAETVQGLAALLQAASLQ